MPDLPKATWRNLTTGEVREGGAWDEPFEWRPFETAPRDGTTVLFGRVDGDFPIVGYVFGDGVAMESRHDDQLWPQPTHWMPLPEGPE